MDPILEGLRKEYAAPVDPILEGLRTSFGPAPAAIAASTAAAPAPAPKGQKYDGDKLVAETSGVAGDGVSTWARETLNTMLFNLPRNGYAALDYMQGKAPTFSDAYERQKAMDEALARQNPNAQLAGTLTGIAAPVALSLATGGAAAPVAVNTINGVVRKPGVISTVGNYAANAGKGLLAGAAGGGASEFADSKDLSKAGTAAVVGGVVGGVGAPILQAGGTYAAKALGKTGDTVRVKPPVEFTPETQVKIDALREKDKLAALMYENMQKIRAKPATAAPEAAAVSDMLRSLTGGDTRQILGGMAGFGLGGPLGMAAGYVAPKAMDKAADLIERKSRKFYSKDWDIPYSVYPGVPFGYTAGGAAGDSSIR